ncbi:hypothetical protein [Amphritea sp. HPY]|uniref:hypothetical protein n=1 Tax=Amphritea sp. HPY TaxID=3421652 RepID=UPI003D7CBF29
MKRFSLLIAVLLGLGTGSIASADVFNNNWQAIDNPSVLRWRFDPDATEINATTALHPYDVFQRNFTTIENPASQDRLYHRAVVTGQSEQQDGTFKVNFRYIENPSFRREI